jgi:integrase
MSLTKRDIDRLSWDPHGPTIQLHRDGEVTGLSVRVYASGKKAFVLRYRPVGAAQPKLLTVGAYGDITLHQARELARRALLDAKTGGDPVEARRKARRGETVRELARVYLDRHAKRQKKSWAEDERRLNRYVIPAIGSKKVGDVKRADVSRLHSKLGDTKPYEANRVLALLQVMFNKAAEWGVLEEGAPNPAARVQKFRERSRDRWVRPAELPELAAAISAETSPYIRAALRLYLLTGLRRSELLGLRWRDVDFERRELRLGDTKAGRSHVLPLSEPAIEVLRELPRQVGNAYVLPGDKPGTQLVNITKPWYRVRARAWLASNSDAAAELRELAAAEVAARPKHAERGIQAVESRLIALAHKRIVGDDAIRLHDLRRTVGSWLATSGASLPLIGKVLNHTNTSTTQIYARFAEDSARDALEQHGQRIGPLLSSDPVRGAASELTENSRRVESQ